MVRIALTGPAYSGKTTLAEYMQHNHGWFRMAYNDIIKERLAHDLSMLRGKYISPEDIMRDKKQYRPMLQKLGDALGFNEGEGVDLAIRRWERDRTSVRQPVIFDNVRFQAQFDKLKAHGFVLVQLYDPAEGYRRGQLWQARARQVGVSDDDYEEAMEHFAEHQDISGDLRLDANRPTEEQADILLRLVGKVRAPKQPAVAKFRYIPADRAA